MNRKITILISNRWYSAITAYALAVVHMLINQGFVVQVFALKNKPASLRSKKLGAEVFELSDFSPRSFFKVRHFIRDFKPEWVMAFGGKEAFISRMLKSFGGLKFSAARFFGYEVPNTFFKRIILRSSLNANDILLVPCRDSETKLQKIKTQKPIIMLPLGIDEGIYFYRSIDRKSYVMRPIVTIVGRLDPVKGHRLAFYYFARMLKTWPQEIPQPRLFIVGEAANLSGEQLRQWAKEQGLREPDQIEFHLYRYEDLPQLMSQSVLGWIPSLGSEIIGRVAQEFLLCGTRICVSGVGGLNDLISLESGASYRNLRDELVPQFLQKEILKGMAESEDIKKIRAQKAKATFSYEATTTELLKGLEIAKTS